MLGWQVAAALERLTPEHRQMIRMAQFRGMSMREIARGDGAARGHGEEPHLVRAALAAPGPRGDGGGAGSEPACEHVRPDLGAYALGALEPAEAAAVEAHLADLPGLRRRARAGCSRCPALIARAEGLEIPPPPAALEERILDRVAASRPRSAAGCVRRPRRLGALAATALAGAAIGAGAAALAISVIGGGDDGGATAGYDLVLDGDDGGRRARPTSSPGDGGTEVHLWVDGLPPGGKAVYEVKLRAARLERRRGHLPGRRAGEGVRGADHGGADRGIRADPHRPR